MPNKMQTVPPSVDLTKAAEIVQPRPQDEIHYKRQRLMDLGYQDHDTGFEMPDGASPFLYDVRFENGGVRKDFPLNKRGSLAPARVAETAHYAYVDPITKDQINRIVRIYRDPVSNLATIDFWDGNDFVNPVQGEEMEDVLVHATVIQGILAFADGKRIHFYEEAETDIILEQVDFLDPNTAMPITESMDTVGQNQHVLITEEPLGKRVTINWNVINFSGAGKLTIRAFHPIPSSGEGITFFRKTYELSGAQSWLNESETIEHPFLGEATEIRLEIESYRHPLADALAQLFPVMVGLILAGVSDPSGIGIILPMLGFIGAFLLPAKFAVRGFSREDPFNDEAAGAYYQYLTAPVTSFRTEGPPAAYVFSFEDRLIALGGFDNPERVAGSADGNPRQWDVVDTVLGITGAFEYAILDSVKEPVEDMIAGAKVAENVAAIVRKRSILRAEETGILQVPLSVKDWKDGFGTESPKSVTQLPGGIGFLGYDMMPYYFTGDGIPNPVGKHIWQKLIESIQPHSLPLVEAEYDDILGEWWIGIPEDGDEGITGFWILDILRLISRREEVWRYKPYPAIIDCLPVPIAPEVPPGPVIPPPEIEIPPPPPPPPPTFSVEFVGKPFEIIEAASTGMVWIGYILSDELGIGGTDLLVRVFDPLTGEKIQELTFPTHLSELSDNYAMCYHGTRDEVWIQGWNATVNVISVVDATTYQQKAYYTYPTGGAIDPTAKGIEWCPLNDFIYADMTSIRKIDPATGAIVGTVTNPSTFLGFLPGSNQSLVWDPITKRFHVASGSHNFHWDFDPDTLATFGAKGQLIVSNGDFPEPQLAHYNGKTFYNPDRKWGVVYGWTGSIVSDGEPTIFFNPPGWDSKDPGVMHITPIPRLNAIAVTYAHDSNGLGSSLRHTSSRIDIVNMNGQLLKRIAVGEALGRCVYAPRGDNIVALELWDVAGSPFGIHFVSIAGINNLPDPPPEVPRDDPKNDPAPTPEPEPVPPAGEPIEITAVQRFCSDTMVETSMGSGLWHGTVQSGIEIFFTPDPDPNIDIIGVQSGKDPASAADAVSGATKLASGHWRWVAFTETISVGSPVSVENKPFCHTIQRDDLDLFLDIYVKNTSTGLLSNKVTIRIYNPRPVFEPPDEEPEPPVPDPGTLNPPVINDGSEASRVICEINENQFPGEAPQTPTDWSGRVTVSVHLEAHHGNDNPLGIPIEFLEFASGANPLVDTPLRRGIGFGGALQITVELTWIIWQYDLHHTNKPSCLGLGSVPNITRDYYARHVLGDGKFGPLSAVRSYTFKHPGP
ncbi:MAG: hypothetical protein L0Y56_18660 [Nitrospira sp.]|nr:hypothetical protein [Nitrospira sp.]